VGGKGRGGDRGEEMTQALYAHMNKRKKKSQNSNLYIKQLLFPYSIRIFPLKLSSSLELVFVNSIF
jgi:hypothetical protein